jgi:predicted transcriptional regulator
MKSILMAIQPYWYYLIAIKKIKDTEIRKKDMDKDTDIYLYESKDKKSLLRVPLEHRAEVVAVMGKVGAIIKFRDSRELSYHKGFKNWFCREDVANACITDIELTNYANGVEILYALHISALKVYDKPKELGEFNSIKQCKPEYSPFGYQWTWEDRHKRNTGGWNNKYRPVPIECHSCKSLVGGKDYLDEKSGCILFDYECVSNYHKPLARPPQSWQYVETPDWAEEEV